MRVNQIIECRKSGCSGVKRECQNIPDIDIDPDAVSMVMISETAPADPRDYYYSAGEPIFQKTTVQAFHDAGLNVSSIRDIINMGVYLTTAVKCGKTGYEIKPGTIEECSLILEKELALFPNTSVYLLMGDVAIKSMNLIARRAGLPRVIPAVSTYKLRGQEYYFRGRRVFPSYLQAGPSFFIEKSKRRMIAEDIKTAAELLR